MSIFKKNHENFQSIKEVNTKEELGKAVSEEFGTIVIKGDLYKDIKEEFSKKRKNIAGKAMFGAGLGVVLISAVAAPMFFVGLAAMVISTGFRGNAKKFRKYTIRILPNYDKTDQLTITHKEYIEEQKQALKDKELVEAGKDLDLLEDAISMNIPTITIDKAFADRVYDSFKGEGLQGIQIIALKDALKNDDTYKEYRVKTESNTYKFIKIR